MVSGAEGSLNSKELEDLIKKSSKPESEKNKSEEPIITNPDPKKENQETDNNTKDTSKSENINSNFQNTNLDLLLDVNMNVTVEIGRTKMKIEEVLKLGSGSIVELNKLNGEPVDIRVNNRLIGQGEVVAVDETFGIKILEIIELKKRINL